MKNHFKQREVLLVIGSTFSCREFPQNKSNAERKTLSKRDQLKLACWDGMVPALLPECFDFSFDGSMRLWEMNEGDTFLDLEYGEKVPYIEKETSLNPYIFLSATELN